jgi:hypothetical protein
MKRGYRVLAILFLLVCTAVSAFGQAETGQILGTVVDPSGAAVPGARVTVKAVATGVERSQVSTANGGFAFPNLQPNAYDVTVEAQGFATLKRRADVTVGSKIGLDLKLEVGTTSTVVEVSENANIVVNTETQTISQAMFQHRVDMRQTDLWTIAHCNGHGTI